LYHSESIRLCMHDWYGEQHSSARLDPAASMDKCTRVCDRSELSSVAPDSQSVFCRVLPKMILLDSAKRGVDAGRRSEG
jgi:hypothetical protein